ncbi:MAG TPA: S8 family peptidase [Aggregatilineaceae bacterium]|nr:S8 family peptidase [Aggregatilineaceae bacterium]
MTVILAVFIAAVVLFPQQAGAAGGDEYILHYAPGTSISAVQAQVQSQNGTILEYFPALNAVLVQLPSASGVQRLRAASQVIYLEPNLLRQAATSPNDPGISKQWALGVMGVYAAWDVTPGEPDVIIAVLDTGIDLNHPDLDSHLLPGYDFVDDDNDPSPVSASEYHGTHVAGIANAETNNGVGVAGVAWNARTMPVRIIGPQGATSADIANGIVYATDNGAKVINLSLSGLGWSKLERDAVNYAAARGVVVIAAAGNDNESVPNYPASYDHVLSVASTTQANIRASSSNYGTYLDLAAPGGTSDGTTQEKIYSTLYDDQYGYLAGTSMAAPQVAGVAALVWSAGHATTRQQVIDAILCSTLDLGTAGRDDLYGWGLVQADDAVNYSGGSCLPTVPHDAFGSARVISGAGYADTVNTKNATSWETDPVPCAGDTFYTVWYKYTPSSTGNWTVDTAGSDYDTVLGIYTGTEGALTALACSDNYGGPTSRVEMVARRGTTYYVMVASHDFEDGGGTLNLHTALVPYLGCHASESDPTNIVCLSD